MLDETPSGWETITLGDLTTIVGGTTPKRAVPEYWDDGEICWATPTDITALPTSCYELANTKEKITRKAVNNGGAKLHPIDTVLMTSRATIGYVAIAKVETATNQGFANFLPNERYLPAFLCYALEYRRAELEANSGGSTFKEISKASLKRIPMLLPPLPEQERIAEILTSVDDSIRATEAVIAQAERVKRGLMEDFFKKSENMIPLEAVSSHITKGTTPTTLGFQWEYEGIPFVRNECVADEGFKREGMAFISAAAQEKMKRSIVLPNDILVTIVGNVGRVAIFPPDLIEGNINQNIAKVTVTHHDFVPTFIKYFLQSPYQRRKFDQTFTAQAQPQLTLKHIREVEVPRVPKADQQRIADILSSADAKIQLDRRAIDQLQTVKRGLMDDLLTGRVRTV